MLSISQCVTSRDSDLCSRRAVVSLSIMTTMTSNPQTPLFSSPSLLTTNELHNFYNDLVSFSTRIHGSDSNDDLPFPLLRLTPAAQGAHWYSRGAAWEHLRSTKRSSLSPTFDDPHRREGMEVLFAGIVKFDMDLFKNMGLKGAADRQLACAAFSDDPSPQGCGRTWSHSFMRSLLVDRLVWALTTERGSEDIRPPQRPHRNCVFDTDKRIKNFRALYLNWPTTVASLQEAWTDAEVAPVAAGSISNVVSESLADPDVQPELQVLLSLWNGARVSGAGRHAKTVELNFCMAAFGLRALTMVRPRRHRC